MLASILHAEAEMGHNVSAASGLIADKLDLFVEEESPEEPNIMEAVSGIQYGCGQLLGSEKDSERWVAFSYIYSSYARMVEAVQIGAGVVTTETTIE